MTILHPEQLEAKQSMKIHLAQDGYALLKAGMRSGAHLIAGQLVDESEYKTVSVIGRSYQEAMHACQPWYRRDIMINKWPTEQEALGNQALIVLENVMWTQNSFANFLLARHRGHHILAYGSNGPEFDRVNEWCVKYGLSYNSWDLNTDLHEIELRKEFADTFERDFCAF